MKTVVQLCGCIFMISASLGILVMVRSAQKVTDQLCLSLGSSSDSLAVVAAQSIALRSSITAQAQSASRETSSVVKQFLTTADGRIGDTLLRVDRALSVVEGIRGDLQPTIAALPAAVAQAQGTMQTASDTIASGEKLMDRYRLLPDEIGAEIRPTFVALEPEFTCRTQEGFGFGGCWHARVTAVLGEAANAGGVFVRNFPQFSGSVNGIADDIHTFTKKAVAPRGFWGTVRDILTTGGAGVRAAGAAGAF